jgi:hypothetical protein
MSEQTTTLLPLLSSIHPPELQGRHFQPNDPQTDMLGTTDLEPCSYEYQNLGEVDTVSLSREVNKQPAAIPSMSSTQLVPRIHASKDPLG